MINFLTNACKHTDQGSIELRLGLGDDGRILLCEVEDTGVGVEPDMRPCLFGAFAEIQQARKEGTGLGLWSVKLHTEALGGSCGMFPNLHARSGSVFWFKVFSVLLFLLNELSDRQPGLDHRFRTYPTILYIGEQRMASRRQSKSKNKNSHPLRMKVHQRRRSSCKEALQGPTFLKCWIARFA